MNCAFIKNNLGWICTQCNWQFPIHTEHPPKKNCEINYVKCQYIRTATEPVKTDCKTCNVWYLFVQSYICEIHKRCLPNYNPTEENLSLWNTKKPESDIYTLCSQCPDFKTSKKPI